MIENILTKKVNVLGVLISSTTKDKILRDVRIWIKKRKKFFVVTPNPEIIMASKVSPELRVALNSADIAIPDGEGVVWAIKSVYNISVQLIKGRVLFIDLVRLANRLGWRIFLIGGINNEAKKTTEILTSSYPNTQIKYSPGPKLNLHGLPINQVEQTTEKVVISDINAFKPHLLFVAFGAPKQETWLKRNLDRLEIGGGMVIGGGLRYVAGMSKLPPKFFENNKLEWLWRLLTEPWRVKRIITAVVFFPILVLKEKFK